MKLISAFVFATRLVQSLFYLNLKFQASSHLLWFFGPVCVGPGRKPGRQVFSRRGSYSGILLLHTIYYIQVQTYCIQFLYLGSYWCIQFLYLGTVGSLLHTNSLFGCRLVIYIYYMWANNVCFIYCICFCVEVSLVNYFQDSSVLV